MTGPSRLVVAAAAAVTGGATAVVVIAEVVSAGDNLLIWSSAYEKEGLVLIKTSGLFYFRPGDASRTAVAHLPEFSFSLYVLVISA